MAFKVTYHKNAITDLEKIFEWSREHHPDTTDQFFAVLFERLDLLADFPYLGAIVGKNRRLQHDPLYVYYRVLEKKQTIKILRLRHFARRKLKNV